MFNIILSFAKTSKFVYSNLKPFLTEQKYVKTDVVKNILTDCNYAYDPYLQEL